MAIGLKERAARKKKKGKKRKKRKKSGIIPLKFECLKIVLLFRGLRTLCWLLELLNLRFKVTGQGVETHPFFARSADCPRFYASCNPVCGVLCELLQSFRPQANNGLLGMMKGAIRPNLDKSKAQTAKLSSGIDMHRIRKAITKPPWKICQFGETLPFNFLCVAYWWFVLLVSIVRLHSPLNQRAKSVTPLDNQTKNRCHMTIPSFRIGFLRPWLDVWMFPSLIKSSLCILSSMPSSDSSSSYPKNATFDNLSSQIPPYNPPSTQSLPEMEQTSFRCLVGIWILYLLFTIPFPRFYVLWFLFIIIYMPDFLEYPANWVSTVSFGVWQDMLRSVSFRVRRIHVLSNKACCFHLYLKEDHFICWIIWLSMKLSLNRKLKWGFSNSTKEMLIDWVQTFVFVIWSIKAFKPSWFLGYTQFFSSANMIVILRCLCFAGYATRLVSFFSGKFERKTETMSLCGGKCHSYFLIVLFRKAIEVEKSKNVWPGRLGPPFLPFKRRFSFIVIWLCLVLIGFILFYWIFNFMVMFSGFLSWNMLVLCGIRAPGVLRIHGLKVPLVSRLIYWTLKDVKILTLFLGRLWPRFSPFKRRLLYFDWMPLWLFCHFLVEYLCLLRKGLDPWIKEWLREMCLSCRGPIYESFKLGQGLWSSLSFIDVNGSPFLMGYVWLFCFAGNVFLPFSSTPPFWVLCSCLRLSSSLCTVIFCFVVFDWALASCPLRLLPFLRIHGLCLYIWASEGFLFSGN